MLRGAYQRMTRVMSEYAWASSTCTQSMSSHCQREAYISLMLIVQYSPAQAAGNTQMAKRLQLGLAGPLMNVNQGSA